MFPLPPTFSKHWWKVWEVRERDMHEPPTILCGRIIKNWDFSTQIFLCSTWRQRVATCVGKWSKRSKRSIEQSVKLLRKINLVHVYLTFSKVSNNRTCIFTNFWLKVKSKKSHSIHMLSIQIDKKSLELVQQHQIVLLCKPYETVCTVIRYLSVSSWQRSLQRLVGVKRKCLLSISCIIEKRKKSQKPHYTSLR